MTDAPMRFSTPALDGLSPDIRERLLVVQEKSGFVPNVFYQATKMLTHFRRVTPHERRPAFALASGQEF